MFVDNRTYVVYVRGAGMVEGETVIGIIRGNAMAMRRSDGK